MVSKNCFCCVPLRAAVTTIAVISTSFYVGILLWLLKERNVVYNFPQPSSATAIAAFWSLITIIAMYALSSVFGVIGSLKQNKNMIDLFRFFYWTMAMLLCLSSSILWIVLIFKQSTILEECQLYVTTLSRHQNAAHYTTS
ncbi:hypothetical protein BDF20DRAFT_881644 [Mycotypha africana]|uniref:uncharacterized protein n=1 Tax=Mycotypha africana TaxID=64632 RepID=UPI002300AF61|nr:uncharacterized protein BDF20DRAFT_881644 [Mycotypha africana]KAI8973304.1 hypothetical protein BDF20DRAFT_881644 [Mycotypha africana]